MKRVKKIFQYDNIGYLYVSPALIYMLFFVGYPIVSNLILSLQDVTVTTLTAEKKPWIGFQNYVELFQDDVLKSSIINTLLFTLACLGIQFIIGMLLALFFNKKFSFANVFDVKAISDSCIDVLIQGIWMALQIAIIDAIITGSLTYLFWLFIGIENVVMYFVWCMTAVFNVALIGNYLGQLNYEALHQAEEKAKKKREKEEIKQLQKS